MRQIQRRLSAGQLIYLTADGEGKEACRLSLPGRDLAIRSGWLTLRRATAMPTLPVLGHRERNRLVVRVYPPLPHPVPDLDRDIAACHEQLGLIVQDFVRRFPAQCFMLALDRAEAGDST